MRPNQDPVTTRPDLPTGTLEPERAVSVTDRSGMPSYDLGDAGHDYRTIAEQGFPVLVVAGTDGPEIVPDPRYRAAQGQT